MNLESECHHFCGLKLDPKYITFFKTINYQLSSNLRDANISMRSVKSQGLWCCFLLPSILILYSLTCVVSPTYMMITFLSIGLLCYSVLFILFMSISCLVIKELKYGGCLPSALVSALLIYAILGRDLLPTLALSLLSTFSYYILIRYCIITFPNTFTVGELMILMQGTVLFIMMVICQVLGFEEEINDEMRLITVCVYTVLSTVGLIVTAFWYFKIKEKDLNLEVLLEIIAAGTVYELILLHTLLGFSCIPKILTYIFLEKNRLKMFFCWLALLLAAVVILVMRTRSTLKVGTGTRKSFHVLASLVFTSGVLIDVRFMTLAAGLGLGLIVLIEALRKANIDPISPVLQSAFIVYSDAKDCGCFAVTPIYLYVGLACPLMLVPAHAGAPLERLAGVLATGVGDTAASWFGQRYGCTKWPGSNRTLEGTGCNILFQILTIYVLQMFDLLDVNFALFRTAIAAVASGLVEAKTEQVDNLILPLITILAFQATIVIA